MSPALPKEDTNSLSRLYLIRVIIIFRLYSVLPRPVVNKRGCNLLIEMHYLGIGAGGDTPGNSWWGVPPGSPNPDPISDCEKLYFSTPVFRPDL